MHNEWIFETLSCPYCQAEILPAPAAERLRCADGHEFESLGKEFYSLVIKESLSKRADTAEMVKLRREFHEAGRYARLKERLADILSREARGLSEANTGGDMRVLDIGSGPGYYGLVSAKLGMKTLAVDLSPAALKVASGLHPNITGVACDIWPVMPFKPEQFDIVLNFFAPKNPKEFARVIKPGGLLILARPAQGHMNALREALPDIKLGRQGKTKKDEIAEDMTPYFESLSTEIIEEETELNAQIIEDMVMMGPGSYDTQVELLRDQIAKSDFPASDRAYLELNCYRLRG